ncbi:MAG: chromosome segregation protein SMC [Vulcanibacillus sp.]
MYLKRIEINGFKSFVDKTQLEFVNGIIAIVGPNGSGKSNIVDAIRWVLGEQSAKNLRGAKMEDIIFSGSDSRKAVNYAEVSIILDNHDRSLKIDYSEVMVTRRLYRSGESEYFLNKQTCRLKDISELFMDTGLGKEAYSIIGQGKIDEILSSKAEDRRGIFEEAAGIVRYKSRKKETQKKLEDTEHNLIRIYDLITELEVQVDPLKEQAEKAKIYKDELKLMKNLNIKIYVHDIEETYKSWQEAKILRQELEEQQLILGSQVNQIDTSIEKKRWSINQIDKELEELHKSLIEVSEKVEQTEGKKEVIKEREKNQEVNKTNIKESINKLLNKKSETIILINKEQEDLSKIELTIEELTEQLKKEEESFSLLLTNTESKIELYKEEYFACLNEIATLRNDISHTKNSEKGLVYRVEKLEKEKNQVVANADFIMEKKKLIREDINSEENVLKRLNEEQESVLVKFKEFTNNINTLDSEIRSSQEQVNSLSSRQEVLIEMQSDFAGYNFGVKEILKLRESKQLNGIRGAVAELITTSKDYETAIETALGSSLQYIVVDSEITGREAISYLKEKKIGRATFLPLDVIKGKNLGNHDIEKIKGIQGYIGPAINLIEINPKYTLIGEFLLGQVIVTSNLKSANEIAKILGYSKRIVTLEGDIVNPGGSMTGGKIEQKKNNLLGRQREIEELTTKIDNLKHSILTKNSKYEELKNQLSNVKTSENELLGQVKKTQIRIQELQASYTQIEFEQKNISERQKYLEQDNKQFLIELEEFRCKGKELILQLERKKDLEKELQGKINQVESVRKENESVKNESNETITELKINLARLTQERDNITITINRLQSEVKELLVSINSHQDSLYQIENDLSSQVDIKGDISSSIEQLRSEKAAIQESISERRKVRLDNSLKIDQELAGSKELRSNSKNSETQLHQCEIKLSRLDTQLENLLKQLAEEYEMSYEWAKDNIEKIDNINIARTELAKLKNTLNALGEVNLGAIEEYDRVFERFNFLTNQRNDLVNARDTLYQVIKEVDVEMTKLFIESFEAIREQFQIVFSKLFGGGRADLILSDPENILDTGIDVVAQPPGKKLQNMTLLSGGEKALTAITLLFAILRVKPVPFSVLDEVDAALDDPNVIRFSEYLREFCKNTQFVVVTHRKGTMEGVDVLYGVTMQEAGVSRLVSVKLEEKEVGVI